MNLLIVVVWLIKLLSLSAYNGVSRVGCRDENNNLIDWYYTYKLPNNAEQNFTANLQNVGLSHGMNYLFITSETPDDWISSKKLINDTNSVAGRTLAPMYKKNNKLMILQYNDQPPVGDSDSMRGHTKGVVVGNSQGGFWLIHSVPHFPPAYNTNVLNIDNISFPKKRISFSTMKDHSKWLVSNTNNWICVGDINRQQHQKVRGGGTVCQQAPVVATSYKNLISSIEPCAKKSNHLQSIINSRKNLASNKSIPRMQK